MLVGQGIVLQKDILPTELSISLDKKQIKNALNNLILNAIQGMKEYPKALNISTINDGGIYSILIEDNGVGISSIHQEKIFDPFFNTKRDATGLGLTDAQRVLMAHQGSIEYKHQETGSLFIVKIPIN